MTLSPVTRGRHRQLADAIAALTGTLFVLSGAGILLAQPGVASRDVGTLVVDTLQSGSLLFVLGFGTVGWLLARRVPHNAIGWCFSLGALMWAAGGLGSAWVELSLTSGGEVGVLTRVVAASLPGSWIFSMPFSVQLPLLLLPDGRLLSSRWRPFLWVVLAGVVVGTAGFTTNPGVIEGTHLVNPMGVSALGPLPIVAIYTGAGMLLVGLAGGVVAVVLRFRRSRGVQRQQMRWVALGGGCMAIGPTTALVPLVPGWAGNIFGTLGILAVPVCVAVAVLRYRLYDLGRVVSRTVSYAVLTALLIGVYLLLVTTMLRLLPNSSSLAVAASTLSVAALFQPLRRRVQSAVDHRFNRARYDADRTIDAFSARLREQVDIDAVQTDLLTVVRQTMQPTSAGLWLRDAAR